MKIYVLLHSGRQFRSITKCPFVKTTQDVSDNINNFPTVKISYKIPTQIKEKENGPWQASCNGPYDKWSLGSEAEVEGGGGRFRGCMRRYTLRAMLVGLAEVL